MYTQKNRKLYVQYFYMLVSHGFYRMHLSADGLIRIRLHS